MIPTSMLKDKRETKGNESDYRLGSLDIASFFGEDMTNIRKMFHQLITGTIFYSSLFQILPILHHLCTFGVCPKR